MNHEGLIDRIYEAAVVPELWPGVLQDVSTLAGCFGGILFTATPDKIGRWTSSNNVHELMTDFTGDPEIQANNIRLQRGIAVKRHGFFGNDELYGREEMESSFVYSKFFLPRGFGYCAGTVFPMPNGDMAAFDLERRYADGPVSQQEIAVLDVLRPHLGRAAVLATRLNLERARVVVDALESAGLAAAILGITGRVLAANALLEGMSAQFVFRAHDRIALADAGANALFAESIEQLASASSTRSIPVPALPGHAAAVAHVLPLPGEAADVFFRAHALMVVTRLDRPAAPSAELLGGLFDLTPAEARVARSISEGKTTEEAAAALNLSRETVRWYLKAIFSKTGVSRQAELGVLLSGAVLRGPDV
jgi:DNA-binding CsgD family transcriptional regulator